MKASHRSIYELDSADRCAIKICSLSTAAGFTGTRCGYTIVLKNLVRSGMGLNREAGTNGVSCIQQKGALAVFSPEGQRQICENLRVYQENAGRAIPAFACAAAPPKYEKPPTGSAAC